MAENGNGDKVVFSALNTLARWAVLIAMVVSIIWAFAERPTRSEMELKDMQIESRTEKRLERIETKLDKLLERP